MCAHQTGTAISVGQISSAVRPDGKVTCDRLEVVGRALGHALLVERVGVACPAARWPACMPGRTPDVQRSSAVGRSRSARIRPSSTLAKYSATISLVTSGVRSVAS